MTASSENFQKVIEEYEREFLDTFNGFSRLDIIDMTKVILNAINENRKIFICGNGGSASLSQHFATDIGNGTLSRLGVGAKIFDLTSNASVLTSIANDQNFQNIFSTQLSLLAEKNDLLIVISSSGNSNNILNAIELGKKIGLISIALTGFDGGKASKIADKSVQIQSKIGSYGIVEDIHSYVLHLITLLVRIHTKRVKNK